MLIVHPSSTCDVCLDGYNWSTPANSPHAIACGHVFCLGCLRSLSPSICPLCRKGFQPDRIKKLHIDRYTGDGPDVIVDAEESELLQRVALFFGENTPEEDVNSVMAEAREWLAMRSDNFSSHRALRSAVTALHQHKILQQQVRSDQERFEELRRQYERTLGVKDQDIRAAKTVEESLIADAHRMEQEFNACLAETEAALTALRSGYGASHPDVARYHNYSNPLPAPPQPVSTEQLTSLARPYTPHSVRSVPRSASLPVNGSAGRSSTGRTRVEPLRPDHPDSIPEEPDELRQDRLRRPPVIVRGAPPTRKVIPSRSAQEDLPDSRRRARSSSRASTRTVPPSTDVPVFTGFPNAGGVEVQPVVGLSRTPVAAPLQYGYVPGRGYVWWPATSAPVSSGLQADGDAAGAFTYTSADASYARHNEPRNEETSRISAASTGEVDTRDDAHHYTRNAQGEASRTVPPSDMDSNFPSNSNSNTNSISSLRSMALLEPPAQNGRRSADPSMHQEMLEILGVVPMLAEPSPASTWGTVNSQASSRHSSLAELGLTGLPGRLREFPHGEEPPVVPPAPVWNDRGPIVEDSTTPRLRRSSFGRSGATLEIPSSAQGESGLGLMLGTGSNAASTGQIIGGQEDLQHLTINDGANTPHRHRHASHQSSRDPTNASGSHTGARTGLALYSSRSQPDPRSDDEVLPVRRTFSRASSGTSRAARRTHGSISDTESYTPLAASGSYNRPIPDSSRQTPFESDYSRHRHHSSMSVAPPSADNASRSRRPSPAAPPLSAGGSRDHRGYNASTRAFTTPANGTPSSLLLSFAPPAPGASAAVTQRGEDSMSSRNPSFGLFSARNAR
ncbi:hypothetical protein B0H21DRAFT_721515 [Amylocystis lapponica]|nr:hypothetical protein B0H21DRAFT_721515 [Amylocystis lapponica]